MTTTVDTRTAAFAKLREPFPAENISKLPKVNCWNCTQAAKAQKGATCDRHAKQTCRECGNYITSGHIHLDYVGHAEATARLLDADPEWTWEPAATTPEGLPLFDNLGGLWIRLTVAGVTRLGYGSADGKPGPNAIKEAIGDAIRNAGMRFGLALDLWAKTDLHAAEREEEPAEPADRPARRAEPSGPADDQWTTPAPSGQLPPPSPLVPTADEKQVADIVGGLRAVRGIDNAQSGLAAVSAMVRRDITDLAQLTKAEANSILTTLRGEDAEKQKAGAPSGPSTTRFATPEQLTKIRVVFNENGVRDRDEILRAVSTTVGRLIETTKQLTVPEASLVIETYQRKAGPAPADEGISVVAALAQIINDARTAEEFDQARADIEREHAEGAIGGDELAALQAQWTDRRNQARQAVPA